MKDSSKSIKIKVSIFFCLFVYQVDTPVNVVLKVKEALKLMTFKRLGLRIFILTQTLVKSITWSLKAKKQKRQQNTFGSNFERES